MAAREQTACVACPMTTWLSAQLTRQTARVLVWTPWTAIKWYRAGLAMGRTASAVVVMTDRQMLMFDLIIAPYIFNCNFAADICLYVFFLIPFLLPLVFSLYFFTWYIYCFLVHCPFFFFQYPTDCNPLQVCQDLNGECMHIPTGECPNGLINIPNGCSGFECTCCVTTSGLLSCPASPSCPGRCRDARVCPVVITGTACNTDGCSCCLGKYKKEKRKKREVV